MSEVLCGKVTVCWRNYVGGSMCWKNHALEELRGRVSVLNDLCVGGPTC